MTPTTTPTDTPTDSPTQTQTASPTSTPTTQATGSAQPIESPTSTPSPLATSTGTPKPNQSATPLPFPTSSIVDITPTPASGPTRQVPDDTLEGDIRDGDEPIPLALIYAPSIVDAAMSDQNGAWQMQGITPPKSSVLMKIRATMLENSGFDIPAQAGTWLSIRNARTRNYNPLKCAEKDHLSSLYYAAMRIRFIYKLAAKDQAELATKIMSAEEKQMSGRALSRALFHATLYFELSAQLPDRELLCTTKETTCATMDFRRQLRQMRQSATYLRLESLLFNRRLRMQGFRSEKLSNSRIRAVRGSYRRVIALIKKLPQKSFDCSAGSVKTQGAKLTTGKTKKKITKKK